MGRACGLPEKPIVQPNQNAILPLPKLGVGMRWTASVGAAMASMLLASPANAEWHEARTNHFLLTIDDTAANARAFAERLERFDAALRRLYGVGDDPDQHSRPIQIFSLEQRMFQQTCGCLYALGYYLPRMHNSAIFSMHMPDVDRKSKEGGWSSQAVLLHEYGHHFSYNNFPIAYPYWFSEGFAEFNATARFDPDGSVVIGLPVNYRAPAIKEGGSLSPNRLFAPERFGFIDNIDLLYGRSWLLTHFLMLRTERAGQLKAYLDLVNKGTDSLSAAEQAFGDLKTLNSELNAYAKGTLAPPLRISPSAIPIQVTVRTLSPGEAEMAPIRARFITGIREGYRAGFAAKAASVASRFPTNATVQEQWAEVELLSQRYDRADAAAEAALRLDPGLVTAMVIKGLVAEKRLGDAQSKDPSAWAAARSWFIRANKANPNTVLPLFNYYSSFVRAKEKPTEAAVKGLMRAQILAPESPELRGILARQLLIDGDTKKARALLQSLAYAPHRKRDKNVPKEVIALIDAGKIPEAKAAIDKVDEKDDKDD